MRCFIIFITLLSWSSCQPKIYPTRSTLDKEEVKHIKGCVEFIDYIEKNFFYVEEDNSYLHSEEFGAIVIEHYYECLFSLNLQQIKALLGKPSCETENQLCYYWLYKPASTALLRYKDRPFKKSDYAFTLTMLKDNQLAISKPCRCTE